MPMQDATRRFALIDAGRNIVASHCNMLTFAGKLGLPSFLSPAEDKDAQ
jgi:hypothetical protein